MTCSRRLSSFWHYEYYQIILREYFDKKKLSVINVKKFTELIEHIDLEVVRNFDSRKTGHLAKPLSSCSTLVQIRKNRTAPIEALSIFYDDKNLTSIVERLDHEKQNHERWRCMISSCLSAKRISHSEWIFHRSSMNSSSKEAS